MTNVVRIFNDPAGVEIVSRTGRSPSYEYQSLGCSHASAQKMLAFATQVCLKKPFSNVAMARSLIWPRQTDCSSFFCAELVAKILQVGGLLSAESNPGAATPAQLHALYKDRAAVSGNPHVMRELCSTPHSLSLERAPLLSDDTFPLPAQTHPLQQDIAEAKARFSRARHAAPAQSSATHAHFRPLCSNAAHHSASDQNSTVFTMRSLDMRQKLQQLPR